MDIFEKGEKIMYKRKIDETEDEAINKICKIIDRAEKALEEKEYLK
jgi:hypothetical protein